MNRLALFLLHDNIMIVSDCRQRDLHWGISSRFIVLGQLKRNTNLINKSIEPLSIYDFW